MRYRAACLSLFAAACALTWAPTLRAVPFQPGTQERGPEAQARAYLAADQAGMAIQVLKEALAKTPNSARLHYHLGLAYAQDRKPDLAEAEFRTALREDPDFTEAHLRLANLSMSRLSPSRPKAENHRLIQVAINQLEQVIEKNPYDTKRYYQLASAYINSARFREKDPEGAFAEAVKVLEEVRKRSAEEVEPYIALGDARVRYATFVASGTKFPELKGETAKKCNQLLDDAVRNFTKALAIDPRNLVALNRIAAIQYNRGKPEQATKTLEDHIAKLEKPGEKATCYRWMADYYMRQKNFSQAEAKLNTAIKTEPKELHSYLLLAEVLRQRKLPEQAADTLARAIEVAPNFINAHVQLGLLELGQGNKFAALDHFKHALDIAPRGATVAPSPPKPVQITLRDLYVTAATRRGEILVGQAQFQKAINTFRRLATIIPKSPLPEYHIGQIYRQKGDTEAAKEHYQNALRRDENFVPARAALGDLVAAGVRFAANAKEQAVMLDRAIEQYMRALESMPENANLYDRLASLRVSLARTSTPASRAVLEQALADASRAVKLAPASYFFRGRLALIHHELGNEKEAVDELKTVIEAAKEQVENEPENVNAIFRLADLRSTLHSWRPDEALLNKALRGYELAVKKQPEYAPAYLTAARVLEDEKDYQAAAEWYEKLLEVSKGEATVGALAPDRSRYALQAAAELAWL